MQVLHIGKDLPVSIVLNNLLQRCFPEEYATRKAELSGGKQEEEQEGVY